MLGLVVNNNFWQLVNKDLICVTVQYTGVISWVLSLIRTDCDPSQSPTYLESSFMIDYVFVRSPYTASAVPVSQVSVIATRTL